MGVKKSSRCLIVESKNGKKKDFVFDYTCLQVQQNFTTTALGKLHGIYPMCGSQKNFEKVKRMSVVNKTERKGL